MKTSPAPFRNLSRRVTSAVILSVTWMLTSLTYAEHPIISDDHWASMGALPGTNGHSYVIGHGGGIAHLVADDLGNVYVSGHFTAVGNVMANSVARWDGSAWSALGEGIIEGTVNVMAVSGSGLFVGGRFDTAGGIEANNIAHWDGRRWWPLDSEWSEEVTAITVAGDELYAAGDGGQVARWDGLQWTKLGSRMEGRHAEVFALMPVGNELYAGGRFETADGKQATNIANWDGLTWTPIGEGAMSSTGRLAPAVRALALWNGELVVGGTFGLVDKQPANNIAKWNGDEWEALGKGLTSSGSWDGQSVFSLAHSGNELYVAGTFDEAGGESVNHIARWDGERWSSLGDGLSGSWVNALAVSNGLVYAGEVDSNGFNSVGVLNGHDWAPLQCNGFGLNAPVQALKASHAGLYVGGLFGMAGGRSASSIAQWDSQQWAPLDSGFWGNAAFGTAISCFAEIGDELYMGGAPWTNESAQHP
jgi:trimeric autotransporter adhesin